MEGGKSVMEGRQTSGGDIGGTNQTRKAQKQKSAGKQFIIIDNFPPIRCSLLERGWTEQEDPNLTCFDLKWTLKTSDIDFGRLQQHQIVSKG